jgi:hypothetical protein
MPAAIAKNRWFWISPSSRASHWDVAVFITSA